MTRPAREFGWLSIVRLGLVQAALGAIVVITTSTLNRVMVVELALPALLPGLLVAIHYAVQISRPRMGHGSDIGGRHTPWIIGGMSVLALGGTLAAVATAWMATQRAAGIALALLGFVLIGLGVSAGGTSLLALLAKRVAAERRAAAATIVWLMMIIGFAVTAGIAGRLLDPYSPQRLMAVTGGVALLAWCVSVVAIWGLERRHAPAVETTPRDAEASGEEFRGALRAVWGDDRARRFAVFVFLSMLAYSAQDLILEPFAGAVMGYTPGQSTSLSGVQHGGVLVGMLLAAMAGRRIRGHHGGSLRSWILWGCVASAMAMSGLVVSAWVGPAWPFKANVWLLGVANGAFSIAAIGAMMQLAGEGLPRKEGVRMGLWGAAQALAFALGGLLGTGLSDLGHALLRDAGAAYAAVFAFEAGLFLLSARLAAQIGQAPGAAPAAGERVSAPHLARSVGP